jgi:hypothetical protein
LRSTAHGCRHDEQQTRPTFGLPHVSTSAIFVSDVRGSAL